ncbi:hypothetical protein Tco_0174512 [Tanacetum coccineum]
MVQICQLNVRLGSYLLCANYIMANAKHAPSMAPPIRTDEQIMPRIRWVPIGKSNYYLNEEKSQPSPIYKIAVDILKQTNFFRAFTASSTMPAIYIQQFWDTICFDSKAGSYKCQLDEQWFDLTKDTLRDALQITPVDNNRVFSPPLTLDTLIDFVNELGYPKEVIHMSNVTTNDMFQPWRALTTIINLCLTGKTSGFERPRAPVLQILWGVVNRAYIDYAKRMWEEFTQSIHTFTEDKRNLAQHTLGRRKLLLSLSRVSDSLSHLKFSAKGRKREVFGMTIPNELINDVIRGADYYDAYLEKVAKHQRYIAGEELSDPDSPAPKLAKTTKQAKPKAPKQTKPTEPKAATKKSKPTPAKPQEKKRKPVSKLSDVWSSSPVVFRETDTGKFQPLPEVSGKGKRKTTKKKSPTEQYIFQRHTPVPSEPAGHEESSSLYVELGLSGSDTESDDEMPSVVRSGARDEGQAGPDPGKLDEGQAGPNPDDVAESQPLPTPSVLAGPNLEHSDVEITDPSNQPQPEHMDEGFIATAYPEVQENLKLTQEPLSSTYDVTDDLSMLDPFSMFHWPYQPPQPQPFQHNNNNSSTTTSTTTRKQSLEEPFRQAGSRINKLETIDLPKMIREQTVEFIDSQEIDQKINESVKEVVISSVKHAMRAPLRARFKDLPTSDMKEILLQRMLEENYDKGYAVHREETKKKSKQDSPKTPPGSPPSPPPPPPPPSGASGASSTTRASDSAQAPPPPPPSSSTHQGGQSTSTAALSSSKTVASAEYSAWTTTDTRIKPSIIMIPDDLYMDDETTADEQAYSSGEEVGCDHIPTVNLRQSWWKPLTKDRPATPELAWTIPSSELHVPTNNWASALKTTYVPPPENSLLAQTGDIVAFMDWYCKRQRISELTPKDLEGPAYEIVKAFHPDLLTDKVDDAILQYNVSKPLPLGGEPGHITIQSDFFFNKDLEYLRYGRKIGRLALSISKMKAAFYPDVGLEQLVPDQFWIEEECKYDIAAIVIRIEVFSMYGYNYMKKIIIRRADLKEYVIAERDFKYMYPSDFEDLYLLNLQGHLNHLSPDEKKLGIESYQTQLNLTKPRWDATGFEFKHDYTVIDCPRAITFRDRYGVQMILRFNEIHKFSDGTLQQIDEALDYRVK